MLRTLAVIFGTIFVIAGVLGFIPFFVTGGKLFNIFRVNFEHNIVHLASGILGILSGLSGNFASKMFFILIGIAYALFALLGFMLGDGRMFGMIAVNTADNYLHAGVAITGVLIGLGLKC